MTHDTIRQRAEPIRTYVSADDTPDLRERAGFIDVCRYGTIAPEPNEVGAIVKDEKNPRLEHGMWVSDAAFVERFFLRD